MNEWVERDERIRVNELSDFGMCPRGGCLFSKHDLRMTLQPRLIVLDTHSRPGKSKV